MRNSVLKIGIVILTLALIAGCATPLDQKEDKYQTFPDALSACRQQQPNRHGQKYRLPPTHPKVAECLKRHGWATDGHRVGNARGY